MNLDDLPDEWFEDQGVDYSDAVYATFIERGNAILGLFLRTSKCFIRPMAVCPKGEVYLILNSDIKGMFKKRWHLTLQKKDGKQIALAVPMELMSKEYVGVAGKFNELVQKIAPMTVSVRTPDYMFARNFKFK